MKINFQGVFRMIVAIFNFFFQDDTSKRKSKKKRRPKQRRPAYDRFISMVIADSFIKPPQIYYSSQDLTDQPVVQQEEPPTVEHKEQIVFYYPPPIIDRSQEIKMWIENNKQLDAVRKRLQEAARSAPKFNPLC